jgi:hypothetical protein
MAVIEFLQGLAWPFMGMGLFFVIINGLSLFQTWYTGKFTSSIPLFGAFFLGMGMLLHPMMRPYAWIAVLVDCGTLMFLFALPRIIKEAWRTSGFNLLEEYTGREGGRTVTLRLFRKGEFVMSQKIARQGRKLGVLWAGTIGTWQRDGGRLKLVGHYGEEAVFEFLSGDEREALLQLSGFPSFENNPDWSLDGIYLELETRRAPS